MLMLCDVTRLQAEVEVLRLERDTKESQWRAREAELQQVIERQRLSAAAQESVWRERESEGTRALEKQRVAAAAREAELNQVTHHYKWNTRSCDGSVERGSRGAAQGSES